MEKSIPEYLKKINSQISLADLSSLLFTVLIMFVLLIFLRNSKEASTLPLVYHENHQPLTYSDKGQLFGSRNGKTYTYSWCGGASAIKDANKIYFKNEADAMASGRTLSKLCNR